MKIEKVILFSTLLTLDVSILMAEKVVALKTHSAPISLDLLKEPWIWLIVVFSVLQLYVWNRILRQTALSIAYPISSLFFPLTMICSVCIFHEHVSAFAWLGGVLVTLGIACIGSSKDKSVDTREKILSPLPETERVT